MERSAGSSGVIALDAIKGREGTDKLADELRNRKKKGKNEK